MSAYTSYLDNRFRSCPSFGKFRQALDLFLTNNNKGSQVQNCEVRFNLDKASEQISLEMNRRAYLAGPINQLP